jgi:hypothetical protein
MQETGKEKAAYIRRQEENQEVYFYALENGGYTFHFLVGTENEKVVDIEAKRVQWILDNLDIREYVEPPDFVCNAVDERVEIREDPFACCKLDDECGSCGKNYFEDVTPKMDLLIDGGYMQRFIEEYCPECGETLIERRTFGRPMMYDLDYCLELRSDEERDDFIEELDITDYTWRHSRR